MSKGIEESILKLQIGSVARRIESLMNGDSVRKFARETDVSEGALRKILKGSIPNIETAAKIAISRNVSLDWLIMGMENGIEHFHQLHTDLTGVKEIEVIPNKVDELSGFNEEFCLIPGFHIQVSVGKDGNIFDDIPKCWVAFRRVYLEYRGLTPERCAVIFVKGDSMGNTITDNDSLLVDTDSRTPIDGHIYVVKLGDELYAKRIQKSFDGSLVMISDNKEYRAITVPKEKLSQLCIVGKVVQRATDL